MTDTMRQQIIAVIQMALRGNHFVKITFREDAARSVSCLLGMVEENVRMSQNDELTLVRVEGADDWGSDRNRTLQITLLEPFDSAQFVDKLEPLLESIETVA